jgi:hypothetical protein
MVTTQMSKPAASWLSRSRTRVSVARSDLERAWTYAAVRRGFYGSILLVLGSLTPAYLPQSTPWWEVFWWIEQSWFDLTGWVGSTWWGNSVQLGASLSVVDAMKAVEEVAVSLGALFGTTMVVAGVALLVEAWFRLRPSLYHEVKHWPITLLWVLPMLFAPPIFSHDAYGYAAEGWVLQNGLNPYDVPISVLPGAFADQAAWLWRYHTAMYPPLSLQMFHGLVAMAGNDPYLSAVAMRLPALIGVALTVHLLPRIARRVGADVQLTAWFATVNPLVIIDLVGGAHNDAVMMGLVVLALWTAYLPARSTIRRSGRLAGRLGQALSWLVAEKWFLLAAVIIGVATSIKQPALLAFYPIALIGHPWRSLHWPDTWRAGVRLSISLAVAVGTFVAISFATGLGFGWVSAADVPGLVVTLAPFSLLGEGLRMAFEYFAMPGVGDAVKAVLRSVGLLLTAVVIAVLALGIGRRKPITFLSWSYLTFAFGGIALNSWYLTWGGLLLPLTKPSARIIGTAVTTTAVLLAYEAGNLAYRNGAVGLSFAAVALMIVLVYRHKQEHAARLARQAKATQ